MVSTRPSKYAHLYNDVLGLISAGAFRPGDRIAIKELANRLGVSPTPTREVLSRLAGRGVVEERRSEGFYLTRLDARDAADLYALHGSCVLRALSLSAAGPIHAPFLSPWDLFALMGQSSGDVAVSDVRDYLDDRLKVLRRVERDLVPEHEEETAHLAALVADRSAVPLKTAIRRFHARRRALAPEIVAGLKRPGLQI